MKETKEKMVRLAETLQQWQRIENATIVQTAKTMTETDNTLIRLVMEIIQRDSNMHHRVQQLIIDSMERESINIAVDDLEQVWASIEKHLEMERRTIQLAHSSLEELQGTRNVVQQYLLAYLLADEQKHERLLNHLEMIKKGMYP